MYDDHLENTSPRKRHFGNTSEKLAGPHESKPWNPIIANVFYRAGIIERLRMGTLNIIGWCFENGNPPPVWSQQQSGPVELPAAQEANQVTGEVHKF
jgi:ATP-dependent DNA helicase RecG